jgi:hypothetical protein
MARSLVVLAALSLAVPASPASAQTRDQDGGISTLPIEGAQRASMLKHAAITRGKLAKRVNFGGIANPKTSLCEALDLLSKRYGLPLDINPQAFQDEGVKEVLARPIGRVIPRMQDVPVSTVMRSILEGIPSRTGITFFPRGEVVEVSTVRAYRYEIRLTGVIVRITPPAWPTR